MFIYVLVFQESKKNWYKGKIKIERIVWESSIYNRSTHAPGFLHSYDFRFHKSIILYTKSSSRTKSTGKRQHERLIRNQILIYYQFQGYAPLYENFEKFYLLYVYRRVRDCWNRPICSVPGAMVTLKDRVTHDYGWTFQ